MVPKISEIKFSKLIEKNKVKFYSVAKSILNNDDDIYDAIQEGLISMYQNLDTIKEVKYFSTWGTRIIINKCYDLIRKNKRYSESVQFDENIENINMATQDKYSIDEYGIKKILNTLENDIREIAVLFYYCDEPIKNISKVLNIPEGTIKTKLAKVRKIIKEKLEKEEL